MMNKEIKMVALNDEEIEKVNGGTRVGTRLEVAAEKSIENELGRGVIRRKKSRV